MTTLFGEGSKHWAAKKSFKLLLETNFISNGTTKLDRPEESMKKDVVAKEEEEEEEDDDDDNNNFVAFSLLPSIVAELISAAVVGAKLQDVKALFKAATLCSIADCRTAETSKR
jgi:hypothetical protein